ncbi:flagellar hook-length control protein FliK [Desulfotalea psychrophila]|uniref:Related to polar flagellar hook-length control protein (FliK) n=1 Tax=Desulfotalea psychrophila (strain LSv54 / DSM 12343) TaxID=177439 RepID=Q6AJT5_DESPS|nr:flagellar hook-length control protein FliK [Desulfotalea psychrophila]CAG37391.1 related to polar flagellar hook-length control protein (FliK) [Desulfotalea psychrophila LSv54]
MATSLLQFTQPTKSPVQTPPTPKKDLERRSAGPEEDFKSRLKESQEKKARKKQEEINKALLIGLPLLAPEAPSLAEIDSGCEKTPAVPLNPALTTVVPNLQNPLEQKGQQLPPASGQLPPASGQRPPTSGQLPPASGQLPLSTSSNKQANQSLLEPTQIAPKTGMQENGAKNFLEQIQRIIDGEKQPQTISLRGETSPRQQETKNSSEISTSALPLKGFNGLPISLRQNFARQKEGNLHRIEPEKEGGQKSDTSLLMGKGEGKQVIQEKTNLSGQNPRQENSSLPQGTSFTTATNSSGETTAFPQLFSSSLPTAPLANQPQTGPAQILLPSGNIVYEDEVVQQVTEKFRASDAKTESKINLRLNPEELGKLKVDLIMKEGTLRVNVVTHNRQAHDILEKNMAKLKNILEKQGITVSEMTISQAEESPQESHLFGEHFSGSSQQGQQTFKDNTGHFAENLAEAKLEEAVTSTSPDNESVVNLRA